MVGSDRELSRCGSEELGAMAMLGVFTARRANKQIGETGGSPQSCKKVMSLGASQGPAHCEELRA